MAILMDRRPTLASWPKRIYAWEELPAQFYPALEAWRARGLAPGQVTYIPRVSQYGGGPEFATAWLGESAMIQTARGDAVQAMEFCQGEAAVVDYSVQLLRCSVTVALGGPRAGQRTGFTYNKTKEDQLLPILCLALGGGAEDIPRTRHPDTPAWKQLLQASYAMYNTAKLCYRFGEEIQAFLLLTGQNRGIARLSQPRPQCLVGSTERGFFWIQKDFYGTRMLCIPENSRPCLRLEADRGRTFLCLDSELGPAGRFLLPPGEADRAAVFLKECPEGGYCPPVN